MFQSVNNLSIETRKIVSGNHTRKTANFVRVSEKGLGWAFDNVKTCGLSPFKMCFWSINMFTETVPYVLYQFSDISIKSHLNTLLKTPNYHHVKYNKCFNNSFQYQISDDNYKITKDFENTLPKNV